MKLRVKDGHNKPFDGWKPVTAELILTPYEATLVLASMVETLRMHHATGLPFAVISRDITTPAGDTIRLTIDPRLENRTSAPAPKPKLSIDGSIPGVCERARAFAVQAHGGQRYGRAPGAPYDVHLDEVYNVACELDAPVNVRIAAFLHDVLEDTSTDALAISNEFGPDVSALVQAVTDIPGGANRTERHQMTYPKIRKAGPDAVLLKLCDRIANVRASVREYRTGGVDCTAYLKMYAHEHAEFQDMLYRKGEHETAWACLHALLFEPERYVTIKGVQLDRALRLGPPKPEGT